MNLFAWFAFIVAALLEVGGDAMVRCGLRGRSVVCALLGCVTLSCYGLVVNLVKWDFSKLLGVYVAFFATAAILIGRFLLREDVPATTWYGLALIITGGFLIQFGR
jgi:small multidrug resistance family-3 protein